MKKFKHKITGKTCTEKDTFYYIDSEGNLPKWVVEHSNDWEEVKEIPKYVKLLKGFDTPHTGEVFDTSKPLPTYQYWNKEWTWKTLILGEFKNRFVPATKEEYDAQFKPVLFVTEDGKEIREKDNFYIVDVNRNELHHWYSEKTNIKFIASISTPKSDKYFLYFSTQELAQEYIDRNKPIYSKQQIIDVFDDYDMGNHSILAELNIY